VSRIKLIYKGTTNKTVKKELSHIVKHVKEYGGRFLLKDPQGCYFKMAEPKAVRKTSQAL
jgi:predicted Zn-ribbon and HTH transcriptional regulator